MLAIDNSIHIQQNSPLFNKKAIVYLVIIVCMHFKELSMHEIRIEGVHDQNLLGSMYTPMAASSINPFPFPKNYSIEKWGTSLMRPIQGKTS